MDPASNPALFVNELKDVYKKYFFSLSFYAYSFLKVHLHHSSQIKSHKEVKYSRNQGYSSFIFLMMEVSGSGSVQINYGSVPYTDPGFPKTYGFDGSGTVLHVNQCCGLAK